MQTVGQAIRDRRRELGLTLQELAERARCAKSYLSTIENDRREQPPSQEVLERVESALQLEPGQLVAVARWQLTPGDVRRHVMDLQADQARTRRVMELLSSQGVDRAHSSGELQRLVQQLAGAGDGRGGAGGSGGGGGSIELLAALPAQVPVINKVAAGYPAEFTDLGYPARVADEYVSVPDVYDADAFAARVVGDSMEPVYREGDIVVFSPSVDATSGRDCFVRFDPDVSSASETTFKRVYLESDGNRELIRLQPLNPAYPARVVEREAVAGMYAAVYVVRPVGR